MNEKYGTKWSREETILAMELYCRTPFNKISKTNPGIIKLANLIGRTPGSVGLKMANISHFDPDVKARNLSGMSNASKLDEEIFNEFNKNMYALSSEAEKILDKIAGSKTPDYNISLGGHSVTVETIQRVGQEKFREYVLASYQTKCCITGLSEAMLLLASHIKPWKDSDDLTEKTNPQNGLCLNPWHDKAFDRGFITLDNNYCIVTSQRMKSIEMDDSTRKWFYQYDGKQINLPDKFLPDKKFIEYHNDVIFDAF